MNDQEARQRGEAAKQILESPVWIETWVNYRAIFLRQIEESGIDETDKVMRAKRMLAAGAEARKYLERILKDGKVAVSTIEQDERQRKYAKL